MLNCAYPFRIRCERLRAYISVCLPRWCWHQPRHRCIRWLNDGGHWIQPPPPPPQPPPSCPSFNVLIELDLIRFPPVASVTYLAPSQWAWFGTLCSCCRFVANCVLVASSRFLGCRLCAPLQFVRSFFAVRLLHSLRVQPASVWGVFYFCLPFTTQNKKKKNTGGAESNRSVSFAPKPPSPPPSDLPFTADRQTEAARTQHYLLRFAAHGKEAGVIF